MTQPDWQQMQTGELEWWIAWLGQANGLARIWALYGYRYLWFFFDEFSSLGRVVDFGSGPVSAAYIGDPAPLLVYCVDPLFQAYRQAGLLYGGMIEIDFAAYRPRAFDTALVLNVLDHCDDPPALLRQVADSLRPEGKALIWTHVDAAANSVHRSVSLAAVADWLRAAGLSVERDFLRVHIGPAQYMALAVKP
jgi:SAM-dependent methyltransferase